MSTKNDTESTLDRLEEGWRERPARPAEPTWQQTAENLRETVRRLTVERDALIVERDELIVALRRAAADTAELRRRAPTIADDPDEGGQIK